MTFLSVFRGCFVMIYYINKKDKPEDMNEENED